VFLAAEAQRMYGERLSTALGAVVRRGPFAGMRYATASAVGSTLTPKLLGSYEAELHPVFTEVVARGYRHVIDIGAAEGFYAVGLAMRLPNAAVVAYETSARGRRLIRANAIANGVQGRVAVEGTCTAGSFASRPIPGDTLVVCDCEGAEYHLIDPARVPGLDAADVLLELHHANGVDPRAHWERQLSATHDLTFINVAGRDPALYPELRCIPPSRRQDVLFERTEVSGWLFARAKTPAPRRPEQTGVPAPS